MTEPTNQGASGPRESGPLKGKIWLAPDWDSDETNEEIARDFYGEDDELDPLLSPPDAQAYTRTTEP